MKINFLEEIEKITPNSGKLSFKGVGNRNAPTKFDSIWRLYALGFSTILVLVVFLSKAFTLQVIGGEENLELSEGNRIRVFSNLPERGVIYDSSGKVIVRNKPAFSLELTLNDCNECEVIVDRLSTKIDLDVARIKNEMRAGKANIILSSNLSKEQILPIEVNLLEYPGVSVLVTPQRDYLYNGVFAHLIGYTGFGETPYTTIVGKSGIEKSVDNILSGFPGGRVVQVDSSGQTFEILSQTDSIAGREVTLYVDLDLQQKAYELLKVKVDKGEAIAGAIVAQDPGTGGVLALVSYPSFDPNTLSEGLSQEEFNKISQNPAFPFFNRVISATYPPGSVFKMVMASAVLAENLISEHYQINDKGFISVGEFIFRNWKLDGHGLVDLRRALQVSNDTYFYTVGGGYGGVPGLGIEKISEWSKKFGYGSKTGINLQGEEGGFVPDGSYRDWYLGDTYITSIGQGDMLATPLQVNQITSYFANGGYLLKPQIVKKIEGAGETDVEVISQFLISEEAYEIVREGLNLAVSPGGTGYPVYDIPDKFEGVTLGGKTGTSEFGGPDSDETHAWFTVFGPMDKATIALTVFLEGGGEGSHDAAPIARELLDLWFSK